MGENRKKVRICIVHPRIKDSYALAKKLLLDDLNGLPYELIWDEENPQFVIATELIYTDPFMRSKLEALYHEDVVTIFMAGESMMPDLNIFDYGISFDDLGEQNDRLAVYPLRKFYGDYIGRRENEIEGSADLTKKELEKKTGFCNFIYSNGNGHPNRDKIFHVLAAYKHVDSLGAYLNNTGFSDSHVTSIEDRVRRSVAIKSRYKFTIAFENATQRGYTSEKVFTSLEAHSIPIYWGNPDIDKIVNDEAIINCHKYADFEEVLARIKEIDEDDDLWQKIAGQPWLTKEQQEAEKERENNYYTFLNSIFMEEFANCKKRGRGTFPDIYKADFFGNARMIQKCNENYSLTLRWISMLHKKKSLSLFFKARKYRKAAIYGMGILGELVYEELCEDPFFERLYGMDKGNPNLAADIKCYRPYEITKEMEPDVIVVTVLWDFENIAMELKKQFQSDICRIDKMIAEIERMNCEED